MSNNRFKNIKKTITAAENMAQLTIEGEDKYLTIKPAEKNTILKVIDTVSRVGDITLQSVRKELSATELYTKLSDKPLDNPALTISYNKGNNTISATDAKGSKSITVKELNQKVDNLHKKNEEEVEQSIDERFAGFAVDLENYAFKEWGDLIDGLKDDVTYKISRGEISKDFAERLKNQLQTHFDRLPDVIEWRKLEKDIEEVVKPVKNYEPDYYEDDGDLNF